MGSDTQHVIEEFQRAAGSAAASLRDWGYRLDLSPGSLHEVDRFFRENYRNGKPLPGGKAAGQDSLFVFMIGIYIGEVIRGQSGGDWLLGDPSNPVGTLSLRLSNGEKICPPLWAVGACTAPEEGRVVELCRMAGLNIPDLPATRGDGPLRMPGLQQDAETESFCSTFQVGNEHDQDHLHRCPVCGSENVKKKKPASGNDSLFRFGNFRIYHDRQCSDCSTVWSPAVPRWAAVCCIVAGAVLIGIWGIGSLCVLAADEAAGDNSTLKLIRNAGLLLGIPGGFSVLYGTLTLLGKTGTLRIQ